MTNSHSISANFCQAYQNDKSGIDWDIFVEQATWHVDEKIWHVSTELYPSTPDTLVYKLNYELRWQV